MAIGYAFATGLFKGYNDLARERTAKELAAMQKQQELFGNIAQETSKALIAGDINWNENLASIFKQAGYSKDAIEGFSSLGQSMSDASKPIFGSVKFNFELESDKEAYQNLFNFNRVLSDPTVSKNYLEQFSQDTAGAESFLNFIDSEIKRRQQWVYLNKSGRDEVTKTVKNPAFANLNEYSSLMNFKSSLEELIGGKSTSTNQQTIQSAIEASGVSVGDNQVFVTSTGKAVDLPNGITGSQLDTVAQNMGYENRHVLYMDLEKLGIGDNRTAHRIITQQTIPLMNLNAASITEPEGAPEGVLDQVTDFLYGKVSPNDNTADMINALVGLIPITESKTAAFGIDVSNPSGQQVLEAINVKSEEVIKKNEFSKMSEMLLTELINNYDAGSKSIKTGGVGFLQKISLGLFGEGGQIDQLFDFLGSDEMEAGTTRESLSQVVADELGVDLAHRIGATEVIAISLAYARARAVDGNGRLSNDDFKIQIRQLKGDLIDNKNITLGKLRRLKKEASDTVKDTEYYANIARSGSVTPKQQAELEAYVIVEKARKNKRKRDLISSSRQEVGDTLPASAVERMIAEDKVKRDDTTVYWDNVTQQHWQQRKGSNVVTRVSPEEFDRLMTDSGTGAPPAPTPPVTEAPQGPTPPGTGAPQAPTPSLTTRPNINPDAQDGAAPEDSQPSSGQGLNPIDATHPDIVGKKRESVPGNPNLVIIGGVTYKKLGNGKYLPVSTQ